MAPHSSTLAWKIPWMEEPGRLQSMGSRSQTWLSDFTFTFRFHALEKEMATHSSVLAWRIPGTGKPGGLPSIGSHRIGHDWSNLAMKFMKQKLTELQRQTDKPQPQISTALAHDRWENWQLRKDTVYLNNTNNLMWMIFTEHSESIIGTLLMHTWNSPRNGFSL